MDITSKRGEVSTLVVLSVLAVVGAATLLNATLNQQRVTTSTNAQTPTSCPFDSGQSVQLGETEKNADNNEPRWPISQYRREYDFFSYFIPATLDEARSSNQPAISQDKYLSFADEPGGNVDSKMNGFMGKMFGFKPQKLADAYFMKYKSSSDQGKDTLVKGSAPALKVPINPGDPIMMPDTGYSIGGDKEAMVVFADSDRITLHIGRHEYFVGSGQNNCNGGPCSGGYWIYIRGLCVDKQIVDKYNEIKSSQESAAPDKNPIMLPMVEANRVLGKASGSTVEVIVRDNGPLISIHRPVYWEGVQEKDISGGLPNTGNNPPKESTPSGATATPTPPPNATCGYAGIRCCNPSDNVGVNVSCRDGSACVSAKCIFPTSAPTQSPSTPVNTPTTAPTNVPNPYSMDLRIESGSSDYMLCASIRNSTRSFIADVPVEIKNSNVNRKYTTSIHFQFTEENQITCSPIIHDICDNVGACGPGNYGISYIADPNNSFEESSENNNKLDTTQKGKARSANTPTPTPNQPGNTGPFVLQSETVMEVCTPDYTNAPCLKL